MNVPDVNELFTENDASWPGGRLIMLELSHRSASPGSGSFAVTVNCTWPPSTGRTIPGAVTIGALSFGDANPSASIQLMPKRFMWSYSGFAMHSEPNEVRPVRL